MARLLIWIVLAALAYAVVRNWSRAGAKRARAAADKTPEAMVTCADCGLNVPQSEAHGRAGRWYCSREHLERARPGQ